MPGTLRRIFPTSQPAHRPAIGCSTHHPLGMRPPPSAGAQADAPTTGDPAERDMTAFTVWKFETPDGAAASVPILKSAASDGLVKIIDHAVVSWPTGASRPDISH